jgi:hypothetical protein
MSNYIAQSGFWGTVKSIGSELGTGVINIYGGREREAGAREAMEAQLAAEQARKQAAGGMPSWVLPAAIGGGILAIILLKKK